MITHKIYKGYKERQVLSDGKFGPTYMIIDYVDLDKALDEGKEFINAWFQDTEAQGIAETILKTIEDKEVIDRVYKPYKPPLHKLKLSITFQPFVWKFKFLIRYLYFNLRFGPIEITIS